MQKIIKIIPIESAFHIHWNIGIYCNFDCMYCPEFYHSKSTKSKTLEELQNNWFEIYQNTSISGKKYKIYFSGGEPSANKDFRKFLSWLDNNYANDIIGVGITSNGSASLRYYNKILDLSIVNYISLSTHSEFFDEHKFFNTVLELNRKAQILNKSIHVSVMKEFWHLERINDYVTWLIDNNINHSVNEIDYNYKTRETPIENTKKKYMFDYAKR